MNALIMRKQFFWFIIVLANIVLAFIILSYPLRAINSDGVLYLQTAEAYLQGGWQAAMRLYPWPFYSVLIAWMSQVCHCSLEWAAYLLNIIFQILICIGFFNLACQIATEEKIKKRLETFSWRNVLRGVATMEGKQRQAQDGRPRKTFRHENVSNPPFTPFFAALVILLYPTFNHHRDLIIRDFGYWAFSLWGWFYLIRLNEDQRSWDGVKFSISMLLASLFRLEGIVMLLFAPFAVFVRRKIAIREKFFVFLKAYSATLIFFVASVSYFWLYAEKPDHFGRLLEMKAQIYSGIDLIVQGLLQAKQHIAHSVLTPISVDSAAPLLVGGLIAVYIKMLILTLTPFYSVLIGIAIWKKQFSSTSSVKAVIGTAIFLNVLITIVFLMQSLFLTERYLFGLSFLLLLWAPFALLWIYQQTRTQRPWVFWSVLIIMGVIALISLHDFGPSKAYLKQAGDWVHENVPKQGWVYTNNPQAGFYMQRPWVIWQSSSVSAENINHVMQDAERKKYAWLVFQVKFNDKLFRQQLNQQFGAPIKVFMNEQGDAVLIYRVL